MFVIRLPGEDLPDQETGGPTYGLYRHLREGGASRSSSEASDATPAGGQDYLAREQSRAEAEAGKRSGQQRRQHDKRLFGDLSRVVNTIPRMIGQEIQKVKAQWCAGLLLFLLKSFRLVYVNCIL